MYNNILLYILKLLHCAKKPVQDRSLEKAAFESVKIFCHRQYFTPTSLYETL